MSLPAPHAAQALPKKPRPFALMLRQAQHWVPRCAKYRRAAATLAAVLLTGCATAPPGAAGTAPSGLAELMERPAERLLVEGIRAYDEGQYPAAEGALKRALDAGLASRRDRATAHKLLAFITCTSEREAECEAAFRAARAADAAFALSRSEAGHPLWGPVAKRALP